MENNVSIPNGDQKVSVSLTIKEILSLSGEKFNQDHSTLIAARKKIRQQLEQHQQ